MQAESWVLPPLSLWPRRPRSDVPCPPHRPLQPLSQLQARPSMLTTATSRNMHPHSPHSSLVHMHTRKSCLPPLWPCPPPFLPSLLCATFGFLQGPDQAISVLCWSLACRAAPLSAARRLLLTRQDPTPGSPWPSLPCHLPQNRFLCTP